MKYEAKKMLLLAVLLAAAGVALLLAMSADSGVVVTDYGFDLDPDARTVYDDCVVNQGWCR